jgi:hypothetical protein
VIGRELNADPRFAFDDDHVPVIFGIHFTVEHPAQKLLSAARSAASNTTT